MRVNTMNQFVGREDEMDLLLAMHRRKFPSLIVIKGRRRVGKSRLVAEFAKKVRGRSWRFSGLAPTEEVTEQKQRDHFVDQLASQAKESTFSCLDWNHVFIHLSKHIKAGDVVLFDEISWMGGADPTFIPKMKVWWDEQRLPFVLVICGSVSTWIEDNILNSTAFFGRVNLTMTLEPLDLCLSNQLLSKAGFQGSVYDRYKVLSILGGIPWYLEQVMSGWGADQTLLTFCFKQGGLLVVEFDRLFHDLFNGRGKTYKRIMDALKSGPKTLADIRTHLDFAQSGTLSQLMDHLVTAGFVQKHILWSFKTTKPLKQSLYRISDPYMRFYLKVIEPLRHRIEQGNFQAMTLSAIPGLESHLGFQMESLLLQNRDLLLKSIGIVRSEILVDGPYRQAKNSIQKGCQIDYLIQTQTHNLFICEFKFNRRMLGMDVVEAHKAKCNALKVPRGFAKVPVLFHVGEVSAEVDTCGYFYRIIDLTRWLEKN